MDGARASPDVLIAFGKQLRGGLFCGNFLVWQTIRRSLPT